MTRTEDAMTYEERQAASDADPMWRWKIDRPTPEVVDRTIANMIAAGFVLREPSGWETMRSWCRPGGGSVFSVYVEDGVEYLTHHAIDSYGHDLDPCPKCGSPVDARYYDEVTGWCSTCSFWRRKVEHRDEYMIIDTDQGRICYCDAGNNGRDGSSHNGFGGHRFHIEALDGSRRWSTNNLYTQGEVPERFHDDLPVSHRFVKAVG